MTSRDKLVQRSSSPVAWLRLVLLCSLSVLLLQACTIEREGLGPGEVAPRFELPLLSGGSASLEQFRGKYVLLNFWASWCSPCVAEMPALNKLAARLGDDRFTVVTVAEDEGRVELAKFRKKFSLTVPILLDEKGKVRNKYKVSGYPESFLLDPEGKVVLLADPADGSPRVKMIGPRDWLDKSTLTMFKAVMDRR